MSKPQKKDAFKSPIPGQMGSQKGLKWDYVGAFTAQMGPKAPLKPQLEKIRDGSVLTETHRNTLPDIS